MTEGSPSFRPLRPSRWVRELTDQGGPICPTSLTLPTSIPISSVLEQNVAVGCADFRASSVSSRSPWKASRDGPETGRVILGARILAARNRHIFSMYDLALRRSGRSFRETSRKRLSPDRRPIRAITRSALSSLVLLSLRLRMIEDTPRSATGWTSCSGSSMSRTASGSDGRSQRRTAPPRPERRREAGAADGLPALGCQSADQAPQMGTALGADERVQLVDHDEGERLKDVRPADGRGSRKATRSTPV